MNYAVTWIANGFSPESPFTTDELSQRCLIDAVREYYSLRVGNERHLLRGGTKPVFLVINSIVCDPRGMVPLGTTILAETRQAGIPDEDIVVLPTETTGSPTDALALALYAKEHPGTEFRIFTTVQAVDTYFRAMYPAVARHVVGCEPNYVFYWTAEGGSLTRRLLYWAMRLVTRITAKRKWAFIRWYNFLNRMYARRMEGFERTMT